MKSTTKAELESLRNKLDLSSIDEAVVYLLKGQDALAIRAMEGKKVK